MSVEPSQYSALTNHMPKGVKLEYTERHTWSISIPNLTPFEVTKIGQLLKEVLEK